MAGFRIDTIIPLGPLIAFYFSHLSQAIAIEHIALATMAAHLINVCGNANESANIIAFYSDVDDLSVVLVGLILFAWFSRPSVVETESCVARLGFR